MIAFSPISTANSQPSPQLGLGQSSPVTPKNNRAPAIGRIGWRAQKGSTQRAGAQGLDAQLLITEVTLTPANVELLWLVSIAKVPPFASAQAYHPSGTS